MKLSDLTPDTAQLFKDLADDAGNWSDMPLLGGNVPSTSATRGNLSDLKRKGLVVTNIDEGRVWVLFTQAGADLAATFGVIVHPWARN